MGALSLQACELSGVLVETLIYGVYVMMFSASIFAMCHQQRSRGRTKARIFLQTVDVFLFLLVTAHWFIDVSRLYSAFVGNEDMLDGAFIFYTRLGEARSVLRVAIYCCQQITLDTVLMYRLYVIWGQSIWVIIPPILAMIGSVLSCVYICIDFVTKPFVLGESPNDSWATAAYACSLATNASAVGLIAVKMLSQGHTTQPVGPTNLRSALRIVVEGAGVACVVSTLIMIFVITEDMLVYTFLAIASPVTGISFSLITLRVGLLSAMAELIVVMHVARTREHFVEVSDAEGELPWKISTSP